MPFQDSIINLKEIKNIIFDLDGTLIDSAPSILEAFKQVLEQFSYAPIKPLNSGLIGPPLRETLQVISGESDPEKLTLLVDAFKRSYDNDAYALSTSYIGITEMLESLALTGKFLYLATNKRFIPTKKILQFFEWEKYFQNVYAIDKVTPPYLHKAHMIESILLDQGLQSKNCVYIGDRLEDGDAAKSNRLPFIYVSWGYGIEDDQIINHQTAKNPNDLLTLLCN
jgi:phosphoglycolate phosphatase